jgi:hypothetical protein
MKADDNVSGLVRYTRIGFTICAAVYAVCVLVQVFLAGMAVFAGAENWGLHTEFSHYFAMLPILMVVLAFIGRMGTVLRVLAILILLLNVSQFMTPKLDARMMAAVHPVTAIVLFWCAATAALRSWRLGAR